MEQLFCLLLDIYACKMGSKIKLQNMKTKKVCLTKKQTFSKTQMN